MHNEFQSNLRTEFENFIELRRSMGYSIRADLSKLKNLDAFLVENDPDATQLNAENVLDWLRLRPKESPATLNGRVSFIRTLSRYLIAMGKESFIPPEKFTLTSKCFSPYLLTDQELTSLFHVIDTDETVTPFQGCILSTLLRLIYTCGLRPGEGKMLLRDNVNLKTGEILLMDTKSKRDRIVVMSEDMLCLMRRYTNIRDAAFPDSIYLFPSSTGNPYDEKWLAKNLRRYFSLIHPEMDPKELPHLRVHDFRHLFASKRLIRWIDEGQDLNAKLPYLRTFLGHSTMDETEYYIHILPENLLSSAIDFDTLSSIIPEVTYGEDR